MSSSYAVGAAQVRLTQNGSELYQDWERASKFRGEVYVAGPVRVDPLAGLSVALDAAERLLAARICPIVPQLDQLWLLARPKPDPYALLMPMDLWRVRRANALLRLPGPSLGADAEVVHASEHGVPVFFSVDDVILYFDLTEAGR